VNPLSSVERLFKSKLVRLQYVSQDRGQEALALCTGIAQRPAPIGLQPIDAHDHDALHGLRQGEMVDRSHQVPSLVLLPDESIGSQKTEHLGDEEGVPLAVAKEKVEQRGRKIVGGELRRDESHAFLAGQTIKGHLLADAVATNVEQRFPQRVRLPIPPHVHIGGAVGTKDEDSTPSDTTRDMDKEIDGGSVAPLEVSHEEQEGILLR
jgi:hypothetical protein